MNDAEYNELAKQLFARLEERWAVPLQTFTHKLVREPDTMWLKLRAKQEIIVLAGMQHEADDVPDIAVVARLAKDEPASWPLPLRSKLVWVAAAWPSVMEHKFELERLWQCYQILHNDAVEITQLSEWELGWARQLRLRFLELVEESVFIDPEQVQ